VTWFPMASKRRLHRDPLLATVACADLQARYALLVPEPSAYLTSFLIISWAGLSRAFQVWPDQASSFFSIIAGNFVFPQIADLWPFRYGQGEARYRDSGQKTVSDGVVSFADGSI